jgi:hypothetical protein
MASGSDDQPARELAPQERYGIVSLTRMCKDDGRSLILYERADGADGEAEEQRTQPPDDGESA